LFVTQGGTKRTARRPRASAGVGPQKIRNPCSIFGGGFEVSEKRKNVTGQKYGFLKKAGLGHGVSQPPLSWDTGCPSESPLGLAPGTRCPRPGQCPRGVPGPCARPALDTAGAGAPPPPWLADRCATGGGPCSARSAEKFQTFYIHIWQLQMKHAENHCGRAVRLKILTNRVQFLAP